ncbi:AraC family transcriptional regulator [Bradyrhizobium sp. SSBR45G]|uniref:AraC family transcriptional regulator n=1 Tax=unclassified Bradyrhizobium TaxID=2631580 RepID=UPI002342A017|nr:MULTISPECIES: AraC family transcriptional regulator [unclassified Bradyrhizobium]GLH81483.1 AraC family transcriptional regulator [Bradyrhizobium sp. SSBR45G]GLH88890.1 AraC family transcriptional regulator [Bradyrhizobium sp. SSBR45R]
MKSARTDDLTAPNDRLVHARTFPVWPAWKALLQDAGLSGANVLRRAGLPGDLLSLEGMRLDSATYYRLWEAIDEEAGDAAGPTPLRFAQKMSTDWFNPELFVALCSEDMNNALERLAKYKSGPMAMKVEHNAWRTNVALEFLDRTPSPPRVLMAFKLVFLVQLARLATRSPIDPLRIGWPVSDLSASDAGAYATWFGVSVEDLPEPTIVFAQDDMQRPFLTANHGMWKFFEPVLRQRLAELEKHATTVERLRSALLEALPAGELSMAAICRRLGISTRTLQRRLREEGSTFQQTLDAVRNSLAHHYLHNSSLSSTEISFLLGFEDPNSFVRAFQTWTGSTPQTVRLAHANGRGASSRQA